MLVHTVKSIDIFKTLVLIAAIVGCGNEDFKATGGAAGQNPPPGENGLPKDENGINNRNDLSNPNINGNPGNSNNTLSTDAGCIDHQDSRYNIVFVFDQSGSQNRTDPERIRGAAAATFVQRMTDPSRVRGEVYVNMLGFANSATPGPGGWTKLEPNSVAAVQNNIAQTTPSPPLLGGTHYGPALIAAQQMLSQQTNNQPNARNFVVFLTDGQPDDEGEYPQIVQQLVTTNKATMITVAAGSGVAGEGEQVVRAMAQPTSTQGNQMAGIYQRASQASDLGTVFDQIFQSITTCK